MDETRYHREGDYAILILIMEYFRGSGAMQEATQDKGRFDAFIFHQDITALKTQLVPKDNIKTIAVSTIYILSECQNTDPYMRLSVILRNQGCT